MSVASSPSASGTCSRLFCTLESRTNFSQVRPATSIVPSVGARFVWAAIHSRLGSIVCSTATKVPDGVWYPTCQVMKSPVVRTYRTEVGDQPSGSPTGSTIGQPVSA